MWNVRENPLNAAEFNWLEFFNNKEMFIYILISLIDMRFLLDLKDLCMNTALDPSNILDW